MRILCIHIDGLISFRSSIDQAIASLFFQRISTTFCSFSVDKFVAIIISFDLSSSRNTYFRCLGNSFKISPLEIFYASYTFFSLLISCSLLSFKLKVTSINSSLAVRFSHSRFSLYSEFSSACILQVELGSYTYHPTFY